MAVYKVPQDVEADDKLIGPFSFRQFIYLIVVAISMAGAWGLGQLFPVLAILPLPIIVFFGALALPLRKDQPMEAYLSAVVSYYFLKSHKRFWQPDGIDSYVTIIPAKNSDRILTKAFDNVEATKRLDYLANLVDSHGWAIRGTASTPDTSLSSDLYFEAKGATDVMAEGSAKAQALTERLQDVTAAKKKEATKNMQASVKAQPKSTPASTTKTDAPSKTPVATNKTSDDTSGAHVLTKDELRIKEAASVKKIADQRGRDAAAYATALAEGATKEKNNPKPVKTKQVGTSVSIPDTDTMELTKQQAKDLSDQEGVTIATIAHQARRVADNNKVLREGEEVMISLH